MSKLTALLLLLHLLVWAPLAQAQPRAESATEDAAEPGFLRGEELRYDNANVFVRFLADVPAIPTAVVDWGAADWAVAGAVVGMVMGLKLRALATGTHTDDLVNGLLTLAKGALRE